MREGIKAIVEEYIPASVICDYGHEVDVVVSWDELLDELEQVIARANLDKQVELATTAINNMTALPVLRR